MQTEDPVSHERVRPLHSTSALSTTAVIGSPPDPLSIPVEPPNGTPAPRHPDAQMLEASHAPNGVHFPNGTLAPQPNGVNGHSRPVSPSGSAPNLTKTEMDVDGVLASASFPAPDSADDLPPAKRARKLSDADQASLNHTNGHGHASHATSSSPPLSLNQHRFALSTIRSLKKLKDAAPFLHPVDAVALNIPHYHSIVKHPMDLTTIEKKLMASNPSKPGTEPRYLNADDFAAEVRLVFSNCYLFNGSEHVVSQMGRRVEEVFEKQIKNMPASEEPKPVVAKKHSPVPVAPKKVPRRPSTAVAPTVPTIRRSELESTRPKREIHPPAPKDLPYADVPKKTRPKKYKDDGTAEQLKFCAKLINEMYRKQHYAMASPFYEPVDWVKLDLPTYPKVVKKPMDLSSMQKKLHNREYQDAASFYSDFKLMIRNCFSFNPVGTPVNQAGIDLSQFFDDRWKLLPQLKDVGSDEDEEEDDDSDDEVAALNAQLEMVKNQMAALSKKKKKTKDKSVKPPGPLKSSSSKKSKGKSRATVDDEVLTFEQKKDLSETIQTLDGAKLERVIQIIHEGVPEIRDSTEEIELDIDALPAAVLLKLYNYVLRPIRPKTGGSSRPGGGRHSSGGTGGLKRKSMDEEAEAERIRLLEERIRLFDKEQSGAGGGERGSQQSSDSSDSDSSGSDSD